MSDLFNSSFIKNALSSLTPKQIEDYKKIGESLYDSINFIDNELINNLPPPLAESVAYIEQGIKAGLVPLDLSENEIVALESAYGKEWYIRYGFTVEEIPEVGLSLDIKKEIENAVEYKIKEDEKKNITLNKNGKR